MPVKRDKDGNVIDVPTRLTERGGDSPGHRTVDVAGPGQPTHPVRDPAWEGGADATGPPPTGPGSYGVPTTPMKDRSVPLGRTTVVRSDPTAGVSGPMDDPPVGWLVVVKGPGQGNVATLGLGANSIGREPGTNRVALNHGDDMISRANHGLIVYDGRNRKFWIRHGDGTNLTYVDDEPVLEVRQLEPLTHIRMGRTVLRFVPLCGEEFSWPDGESENG